LAKSVEDSKITYSGKEIDAELLENYSSFFNNSSEAIFLGSPDGSIYKCNPAATTLFGYTEQEFCSLGRDAICDKNDPLQIQGLKYRDKNGELSGIFPYTHKNGTVIYCDITSKYFTSKDGTIRTFTTIRDASKKLEFDKSQVYHSLIIDNISDAVYLFDRDIIISSWNKAAEKLYGWKAEEVIGKNAALVLHTESSPMKINETYKILDEKGELISETAHFTKDNRKLIIEAHIITLKDNNGNTTGYLTVNRDITMRKNYEEQLKHKNKRLEILADLVGVFGKVTFQYNDVLDYTVKILANELGDQCVIRLLNEKETQLVETAYWHKDKECMEYITKLYSTILHQPDESFSGETIKNSKPMLFPEINNDTSGMKPEYFEYVEKFGVASMIFVPIEIDGKTLGTINMYRNKPGNPYTIKKNLLGKSLLDIFPGVEKTPFFEAYQRCMKDRIPLTVESEFNFGDGKSSWFEVRALPIPEGIFILSIDITEQKKMQAELNQSEKKFKSLVWDMQVGVLLQGPNAEILLSNPKSLELLGLSEDQLLGKTSFDPDWNVIHEDGSPFPGSTHPVPQAIKYRRPIQNVVMGVYRPVINNRIWLLVDAIPELDINGSVVIVVCTFVDISEQKRSEENLKIALKDKEVLLRELYHRTKNNMQVVYSLLGLKGAKIEDKATADILTDIGNRIQAIALVHQKLYQSKNLSRIDLKDYITDLATLLLQSYNSSERTIELILELESINVLIDTAIPCGQIIIELISNSFKHAFPDGRDGKISIHLSQNEKDLIKLIISDNGIGISDDSDITQGDTLGIQLFRNIAEDQLQGEISCNLENGVSWTIIFKDTLYDDRVASH